MSVKKVSQSWGLIDQTSETPNHLTSSGVIYKHCEIPNHPPSGGSFLQALGVIDQPSETSTHLQGDPSPHCHPLWDPSLPPLHQPSETPTHPTCILLYYIW